MKRLCFLPLLFTSFFATAQTMGIEPQEVRAKDAINATATSSKTLPSFIKHSTIATISVGFIDDYRNNYGLPEGYKLNNTSGFSPVYGKLEYGINEKLSLGATFCYDVFYSNYFQLFHANGNEYKRYHTDKFRSFSGGLALYYHFKSLIPIKKLDVFVGAGLALNNISHSALPQGDSTISTTDHTVSPIIKVGARYYLSSRGSLFADLGHDRKTAFSLGFSCRFLRK